MNPERAYHARCPGLYQRFLDTRLETYGRKGVPLIRQLLPEYRHFSDR